jgi:hypothetical protein
MFMSVKLDRLAVGSILKQRNGLSNQCSIGANESSYPAIDRCIILLTEFAEDSFN